MTTTEMTDPAQDPPVPEGQAPAPGADEGRSQRTEDFTVKLEEVFQGVGTLPKVLPVLRIKKPCYGASNI